MCRTWLHSKVFLSCLWWWRVTPSNQDTQDCHLDGEIEDAQGNMNKVKPNTINHEHAYLNAVFSELKKLGEWKLPNPLDGIHSLKLRTPNSRPLPGRDPHCSNRM